MNTHIEPIGPAQQQQVIARTRHCIELAGRIFQQTFAPIPVSFSLSGRAAGMYHVRRRARYIRYNPYIFAKFFDDNLQHTVPHEVAHYIADVLYGIKHIKPHGREWRHIMQALGAEIRVTCDYDLEGIPQRRQRRFAYACRCRTYEITTRRHNMIVRGERRYRCPACRSDIRIADK